MSFLRRLNATDLNQLIADDAKFVMIKDLARVVTKKQLDLKEFEKSKDKVNFQAVFYYYHFHDKASNKTIFVLNATKDSSGDDDQYANFLNVSVALKAFKKQEEKEDFSKAVILIPLHQGHRTFLTKREHIVLIECDVATKVIRIHDSQGTGSKFYEAIHGVGKAIAAEVAELFGFKDKFIFENHALGFQQNDFECGYIVRERILEYLTTGKIQLNRYSQVPFQVSDALNVCLWKSRSRLGDAKFLSAHEPQQPQKFFVLSGKAITEKDFMDTCQGKKFKKNEKEKADGLSDWDEEEVADVKENASVPPQEAKDYSSSTVFVYPGSKDSKAPTLYSATLKHPWESMTKQFAEKNIPMIALPLLQAKDIPDEAKQAIVQVWRAVGYGLSVAFPVDVFDLKTDLGKYYHHQIRIISAFFTANLKDRETLLASKDVHPDFKKGFEEGAAECKLRATKQFSSSWYLNSDDYQLFQNIKTTIIRPLLPIPEAKPLCNAISAANNFNEVQKQLTEMDLKLVLTDKNKNFKAAITDGLNLLKGLVDAPQAQPAAPPLAAPAPGKP